MSDVRFIYIIYKTCIYMYTIPSFAQYGFVVEAYKLNSWLGLSEKIVALFHPSTVTFILLSDDGKLVRVYLLYAGMNRVLKV